MDLSLTLRLYLVLVLLCIHLPFSQSGEPVITSTNTTCRWLMGGDFINPLFSSVTIPLRDGILAAFAAANMYSVVKYQLVTAEDGYNPATTAVNAEAYEPTVFGFIGQYGSAPASSLVSKLTSLSSTAPIISPYSGLSAFRGQNASHNIVNLRPSISDEIAGLLSYLSNEWATITSLSVVWQNDNYGTDALSKVSDALGAMGLTVFSNTTFNKANVLTPSGLNAEATAIANAVTAKGAPSAVLVFAHGQVMAAVILAIYAKLGSQAASTITYASLSSVAEVELSEALPLSVTAPIYLTQTVPDKDNRSQQVVVDFWNSLALINVTDATSATLEGYLAGRMVTMAVEKALLSYSWPVTRTNFLQAIFQVQKTFDISGWTEGPYGDVCSRGITNTEGGCWCNQGGHQVRVTRIYSGGQEHVEVPLSTFSFSSCGAISLQKGRVALVGQSAVTTGSLAEAGLTLRAGILSAIKQFNNEGGLSRSVVVATMNDNYTATKATANTKTLTAFGVKAMLSVYGTNPAIAVMTELAGHLPMIGPFTGAQVLRRPFQRNVINLRASYWDETATAVNYFYRNKTFTRFAILYQNDAFGQDGHLGALQALGLLGLSFVAEGTYERNTVDYSGAWSGIVGSSPQAIIIIGTTPLAAKFIAEARAVLPNVLFYVCSFTSDSVLSLILAKNASISGVYKTGVTPHVSSSIPLVKDYLTWVPEEERGSCSLEGFIVGRFFAKVVEAAGKAELTPDIILRTIYDTQSFDLGGYTVGPFEDACNSAAGCCNQGSNMVLMEVADVANRVFIPVTGFTFSLPICGILYTKSTDNSALIKTLISSIIPALAGLVLIGCVSVFFALRYQKKRLQRIMAEEEEKKMNRQAEELLHKILPASIATRLITMGTASKSQRPGLVADGHAEVSILFSDLVKFSQWSKTMAPEELIQYLNELVSMWDAAAMALDIEKIKTIGDAYMCVAGCPDPRDDHADVIVRFGEAMLYCLRKFNKNRKMSLQVRIGANSGPVVAGVIGLRKIIYDVFGPTVNFASRMESSGVPGCIQITENTWNVVSDSIRVKFESRGEVTVKGGDKINAYIWKPNFQDSKEYPDASVDNLSELSAPQSGSDHPFEVPDSK